MNAVPLTMFVMLMPFVLIQLVHSAALVKLGILAMDKAANYFVSTVF